MNRLLAFDHGQRRIGTAVGNTLSRTAQGISTLSAIAGLPQWIEIAALIKLWHPNLLVVGLPLLLDGTEGDAAGAARRFGTELARRFDLPVTYVDERYSSAAADSLLVETALPNKSLKRKRKEQRDSLAAELILGIYFEQTTPQ